MLFRKRKHIIGFSNFKAFGEREQIFTSKPITLIYSPNSVGKSSVVHAIAYLHYLIKGGNPDLHLTNQLGDQLDLGGFDNFVHKHEAWREIKFRIIYDSTPDYNASDVFDSLYTNMKELRDYFSVYNEKLVDKYFSAEDTVRLSIEITVSKKDGMVNIVFIYLIDDIWFLNVENWMNSSKVTINIKHELAKTICNSTEDSFWIVEPLLLSYGIKSITIDGEENIVFDVSFAKYPKDLKKMGAGGVQNKNSMYNFEVFRNNCLFFISHFNREFGFCDTDDLRIKRNKQGILKPINYLAPLRFYPEREFAFKVPKPTFDNRKENQLFIDSNYSEIESLSSEKAWSFLGTKYEIGKEINKWLSDPSKLSTTYEIKLQKLVDFKNVKLVFEDKQYSDDEKLKLIEESFIESEKMVFLDKKKGVEVNNRDLGLGVSQIIPILVATSGLEDRTIAIEQPELHLHPKAQCELADEFIKSYHMHNNSFILETHSEHLLLRMMKRMRHTAEGRVEDEMLKLTPDDVCLLYVDTYEGNTIVKELRLAKNGKLLDIWPKGFFEERYNEVFDEYDN